MKKANMSMFGMLLFGLAIMSLSSCAKKDDPPVTPVTITTEDFSTSIAENPTQGQILGRIRGDVSGGGTASFRLISQNPAGAFSIDSGTGDLSVADATLFDYEARQQLTAVVGVSSGGQEEQANVTISLTDVDETVSVVVTTEDFSTSIAENPTQGQILGRIRGDVSGGGTASFRLISQNPAGAFSIDSGTGDLSVDDASLFDYEARQQLTAVVGVSSGGQEEQANVTISLTDVDETVSATKTIWRGATLTFSKADGADPAQEANQDRITDNVWLTRGNNGGQIYNAKVETSSSKNSSPTDTEWALGTVDDIDNLSFQSFRAALGKPKELIGKDLVLHLITDDIYISVKITAWSTNKAGGFTYERSTQ